MTTEQQQELDALEAAAAGAEPFVAAVLLRERNKRWRRLVHDNGHYR